MFCKNCGAKLPEGARFCGSCGAKYLLEEGTGNCSDPVKPNRKRPRRKKGGIPKLLLPLALVLAVALAAAALWPFFGSKTVYLRTELVRTTDNQKITIEYEYDDAGNLLSYENNQKYNQSSDFVRGSHIVWEYEYEDGRIAEATYTLMDSERLTLEYVYDKNGVLEAVESDFFEAEVTCDKEGRILELEFDNDDYYAEFSYYANGHMEEMDYANDQFRVHSFYNEDGSAAESTTYINGMKRFCQEYAYTDDGERQENYKTFYNGELESEETRYYTYDRKGEWTGYEVEVSNQEHTLKIVCEVETDENVTEFIITDISGDPEELGYDLEEGDVMIRSEYDEHGNLIKQEIFGQGKNKTEYEYIAIKVPRNQEILSTDAPIYMQFMDDMF